MKIGILTYHSVYNFGANLQVYSTISYLKNKGHDPVVINWIPEDLEAKYDRTIPKVQVDSHKRFIEKNMPRTELCRTVQDVVRTIKNDNIQGVIIGSDAVLQNRTFLSRIKVSRKGIVIRKRPGSDVMFPNPFWGNFIPLLENKIPVVIMSASSQNANFRFFRGPLRHKMGLALRQFDYVSVRDTWTKKMVTYLTRGAVKPDITPDPVFSYNQNISEQYSKEELKAKFELPDNYLLVSFRNKYCVTKEWLETLNSLAGKENLHCVVLPMPNGNKFSHPFTKVIDLPLSPEEWYGLIRHSSGYIGENMHPIVVSLHCGVPFFAFDSYGIVKMKYFVNSRSSKVFDLVSFAGFTENIVNILGKGYKCPSAESVIKRIVDFDLKKCKDFSHQQQERYNTMMSGILTTLKK